MRYKIIAEADPGESIETAARKVSEYATNRNNSVILNFNDTEVIVAPGDDALTVVRWWGAIREQDSRRRGAR